MEKEKVYMVCDWFEGNVNQGANNIGVEYIGDCKGRILREDGSLIGRHHSSSYGWLREDLKRKLDDPNNYEIIDLITSAVPDRFKLPDEPFTLREESNDFTPKDFSDILKSKIGEGGMEYLKDHLWLNHIIEANVEFCLQFDKLDVNTGTIAKAVLSGARFCYNFSWHWEEQDGMWYNDLLSEEGFTEAEFLQFHRKGQITT